MNGLPYYKAYPRDFFEGTVGMPCDLKGAYRLVLDLIYMHGGELLDDRHYISGHLGCTSKQWTWWRKALLEAGKITVSDGKIRNNRASIECVSVEDHRRTQRENRAKRTFPPKEINDIAAKVVQPKINHTDTDTDTEREEKKDCRAKARRKPELPLPEIWVPSDRNVSDAVSRGFSQQDIENEADRFRDHHLARGTRFRDWDAAWRTWLGNVDRFAPRDVARRPNAGGGGRGSSLASIAAQRRLADAQ